MSSAALDRWLVECHERPWRWGRQGAACGRSTPRVKPILPGLRTPGAIAEHIVFGRALHLHRTLGEEATELTPLLRWGDADVPPHTAAEILQGLELTWRFITDYLMRGSLSDDIPEYKAAILQTIWGLLDHDLPHAGELSLLLGAHGLPGVEM